MTSVNPSVPLFEFGLASNALNDILNSWGPFCGDITLLLVSGIAGGRLSRYLQQINRAYLQLLRMNRVVSPKQILHIHQLYPPSVCRVRLSFAQSYPGHS